MSDIFCHLCNSTVGGTWLCADHETSRQERIAAELALEQSKKDAKRALDEAREAREQPKSAIMAAFDVMDAEARKAAASYPTEQRTANEDVVWQIDGWVRGHEHMGVDNCSHLYRGWCYVVAAGADVVGMALAMADKKTSGAAFKTGAFKIGSCRTATREALEGRLKGIQGMCPVPLRIVRLFAGGEKLERELHRKFAAHRLHGEWFSPAIFKDLPYAGCPECNYVVMPLDEKPKKFLRALRTVIDEVKK